MDQHQLVSNAAHRETVLSPADRVHQILHSLRQRLCSLQSKGGIPAQGIDPRTGNNPRREHTRGVGVRQEVISREKRAEVLPCDRVENGADEIKVSAVAGEAVIVVREGEGHGRSRTQSARCPCEWTEPARLGDPQCVARKAQMPTIQLTVESKW